MALDLKQSSTHWLVCECGNSPSSDGFYPCLADGSTCEPDINGPWDGHLYRCESCNSIYDAETLEEVAKASRESFA